MMLLMRAARIAFIEDNINLTLNFHLILGARTWAMTRRCLRQYMFSSHILPPSASVKYYRYKSVHAWQSCSCGTICSM